LRPTSGGRIVEGRLLRAARKGERSARERLVVEHLGLVRSVASRYRGLGLPLEDLVQEGSLGLLDAIDRFDPDRGSDFESFARFRVRRAVRNALTSQARLIRLPKQVVERRRTVSRAEARLTAARGGRGPTPADVAAETGLPLSAVIEARSAALPPLSLDEPVLPDGSSLESIVADRTAADPELETLAHEQADRLGIALGKLDERQRRVIRRQWGISGDPGSSVDLAAELNVSPRRVQTIGQDALYVLRRALSEA
jgi:RNA polymerase sigma factor (sigma-70 family)